MQEDNATVAGLAQDQFLAETAAAQANTQSQVSPVQFEQVQTRSYTEEDLRKVREQEKSKLYPQIEGLKEELNLLKKEREDRLTEEVKLREAAEADARKKAEADMDVRSLLDAKEKEWQDKLEHERVEREKAFALLERERTFSELSDYRNRRLAEEQDNIIPELLDLVTGNSSDEIEQSIAGLKDRSSRILDSAQQAMQSARREMTGSRVTAPASGPLDTQSENQQFTAEQISAMSVSEYAKYRQKLLGQAASARGKGLFG